MRNSKKKRKKINKISIITYNVLLREQFLIVNTSFFFRSLHHLEWQILLRFRFTLVKVTKNTDHVLLYFPIRPRAACAINKMKNKKKKKRKARKNDIDAIKFFS